MGKAARTSSGISFSIEPDGTVDLAVGSKNKKILLNPVCVYALVRSWLTSHPVKRKDIRVRLVEDVRTSVPVVNKRGKFIAFLDQIDRLP